MKYTVSFKGEHETRKALYKAGKLVLFDDKAAAEAVASALDGSVTPVVPFGDDWIDEQHFHEIQYTDLMNIWSENEE